MEPIGALHHDMVNSGRLDSQTSAHGFVIVARDSLYVCEYHRQISFPYICFEKAFTACRCHIPPYCLQIQINMKYCICITGMAYTQYNVLIMEAHIVKN
jgi:hypothetical protein